jgi:ankyrin repeat protein
MLDPGGASTNVLFSQASRSLNSLAQDFETVGVDENIDESPPPYVNSRVPSFPRDLKRRNTQGSMELNAESTNLIQVVRENQVDLLLALLDHGVNIDDVDPTSKRTAIIEATNLRRTKMSQILIRSGSRLHLKDIDGNTALHFAAFNGDSNTCVLLLNAGAQLNEYNRDGETPLDLAARGGHTEAVICLLNSWVSQNGHATTLLKGFLEATSSGNASTAQAFIERGVQPKKLKDSWKPVIYAAQSGSIPMTDLMLAEKCNIKAKDPEG